MHKALSNILQQYLRQETLVTSENGAVDEELLESLHKCLEEKGVLKEVHAFLRKRLVAVLQGTWPQLFDHFRTDRDLNPIVLKLIEDFLCSHKLLFTLSIFTTELGEAFCPKVGFGKFSSLDAEGLLFNLGIRPDSTQSQKILENYSSKGNKSLFECIITFCSSGVFGNLPEEKTTSKEAPLAQAEIRSKLKNFLTLDERLKKIDDKFRKGQGQQHHQAKKQTNLKNAETLTVDQRFRHLALDLERDKQIQLQIAIEKFKSEEILRIREEIETEQKFELLRKEKELLGNYEEKVKHLKNNLEREKEVWMIEKTQKEREILNRRDELLVAIQSVHEKGKDEKRFSEVATQTLDVGARESDGLETAVQGKESQLFQTVASQSQYLLARTPEQREMERAYLLREAKLKLTIEKLEKENGALRSARSPAKNRKVLYKQISKGDELEASESESSYQGQEQRRRRTPIPSRPKGTEPSPIRSSAKRILRSEQRFSANTCDKQWTHHFATAGTADSTDTVAMLQYQLECQSEEIEKLRSAIENGRHEVTNPPPFKVAFQKVPLRISAAATPQPPPIPKCLENSDVDGFLRDAKQRIFNIEREATLVEETLKKIRSSDSAPPSNFPRFFKTTLPPPPTIPESLLQRLSALRDQFAAPKIVKPPIRQIPDIPSIPGIQKSTNFYRPNENTDPEWESMLSRHRQSLLLEPEVISSRKPSSDRVPIPDQHVLLFKNDKLTAVDDGSYAHSLPSSPPASRRVGNAAASSAYMRIQEDAETSPSTVSSISYLRKDVKNDIDKSLDRVAPRSAVEEEKNVTEESMTEQVSIETSASRSGALVKKKMEGAEHRGGGEGIHRSGGEEIHRDIEEQVHRGGGGEEETDRRGGEESLKSSSSAGTTLKTSASASGSVFLAKSMDLKKVRSGNTVTKEKVEVEGRNGVGRNRSGGVEKGFLEDSKYNPINATSNSTFPMSSTILLNKEQKLPVKPHLSQSLAPPSGIPTQKNVEEEEEDELEDLGMIETSEDLARDENLFWQM